MFSKLFKRNKNNNVPRSLEHPRDLKQGDAIKTGFDEHPEISNVEHFVERVTGLDLAARSGYERRIFHLGQTADNRALLMWVHDEGNGEQLAFAYSADQPHVESMIRIDQFAELFNADRNYLVELESHEKACQQNPWLSRKYIQDQSHEIYWLDRDPKGTTSLEGVSENEQGCDYFRLTSNDRKAAIEAFVFDGGRTDVYFVKYLPLYKIEEMMPSA
ncbi:MAG: hypothetical protein JKY49_10725 [Cohaesibacteraceae bacterium]|nr:hypothetical protein [Cohaesibacteraceae bacterium]